MIPLSGAVGVATDTNKGADGELRALGDVYMTPIVPGGRIHIAPPYSGKTAIRKSFGVSDTPPQEPETVNAEHARLRDAEKAARKGASDSYLHCSTCCVHVKLYLPHRVPSQQQPS